MLRRQQILDLAAAYREQEDALKSIKWGEEKLIELEDEYSAKLADRHESLTKYRCALHTAERTIFELETLNGNFGGTGHA